MDHLQGKRHRRIGPGTIVLVIFAGIGLMAVTTTILGLFMLRGSSAGSGKGNVGLIKVEGIISSSNDIVHRLVKLRKREQVKAIVVRVDSPGGAIAPAQEIYAEIGKTKKEKPVVVSMGSLATSGGYYIASAANKIVANPGTVTGSIGVIMQHFIFENIARKLLLRWEIIKAGKIKDIASPLRSLRPDERKVLQNLADEMHRQFIRDVATGRNLSVSAVESLATGVIFSGEQALKHKLIDELGNLHRALEVAGKLGKVKEPEFLIETEREGLLDFLAKRLVASVERTQVVREIRQLLYTDGVTLPMTVR